MKRTYILIVLILLLSGVSSAAAPDLVRSYFGREKYDLIFERKLARYGRQVKESLYGIIVVKQTAEGSPAISKGLLVEKDHQGTRVLLRIGPNGIFDQNNNEVLAKFANPCARIVLPHRTLEEDAIMVYAMSKDGCIFDDPQLLAWDLDFGRYVWIPEP